MAPKKTKSYNFPDPIANAELVGHSDAQNAFMDAWRRRAEYPIHPVWILSGVRGIGKATLAYRIARFVFGEQMATGGYDDSTGDLFAGDAPVANADNSDAVFQKMLDGGFGDFFIIDTAHNLDANGRPNPDVKSISVHTLRKMIEKMQLSSMEGGWRVVIIDSLDELSVAAQNAILKLLEEPPANTLFLVVVHSLANTLPTIRSRARVEKLHPLTISELRDVARILLPDDEQDLSPATLRLAAGSFGRIANLKKNGGDELYEDLLRICKNDRANASDIMTMASAIAKAPEMNGILLDAVAHFGLADLYPTATQQIADITRVHLEPEIAAFRIISDIRKCL
ncbi:MAG: hypothetical protein FWF34_00960 [Alphaproteobacteria bacterium]|nr:hypothetical protein [Alphaproteobacteria bacterium]MCL2889814.1 hypothetical protein [Alphaproteobacteria bacterium]